MMISNEKRTSTQQMKKSLYIDEMLKKKNKQTAVLPIEEEEKEDVFVSTLRSEKRESENSAE